MVLPERIESLCRACAQAGGRALIVGGSVRDHLLGLPIKDVDVEVHRLSLDALRAVLGRFGKVNEVGRSFGVLKVRIGRDEVDVSLPRRDSKAGAGHRGIHAEADPDMGEVEAARRRDLTINAIAYDPLTSAFVDPFDGRADIARRLLRAVDERTFGEDPLRALRAAQFAGRFGFGAHPDLIALCSAMPLVELPAERIRGEVEKLLLRSPRPSVGWAFARAADLWSKVLPTWDHDALPALDRCAAAAVTRPAARLALLYAAASSGPDALRDVLERLRVFRVDGYPVREAALFLAAHARDVELDAPRLRRLADDGDLRLLAELRGDEALRARAAEAGVLDGPLPPLLAGRDLLAMGVRPGPQVGALLAEVRERQFDGALADAGAARSYVTSRLGEDGEGAAQRRP
jgi:tRNA nucleotidyltransferase (CCA-adding enzyme)